MPTDLLKRDFAEALHRRTSSPAAVTLRQSRRREELRDYGATQHANGAWSIPIATLVSLGMLDHVTSDDGPADDDPQQPAPSVAGEVAALRVEVERERGLRIAAEREMQAVTAHLTSAQSTIRMIEAAPPKVETRVEHVEVPVPAVRRWV